jgi:hypothetical protein
MPSSLFSGFPPTTACFPLFPPIARFGPVLAPGSVEAGISGRNPSVTET